MNAARPPVNPEYQRGLNPWRGWHRHERRRQTTRLPRRRDAPVPKWERAPTELLSIVARTAVDEHAQSVGMGDQRA